VQLAQPRRLQAGDRGDRREAFFDRVTVEPDRRRGLNRERVLPHPRLVDLSEHCVEVRDRELCEARLIRGAGALLEHRTRALGAGGGEEQRGITAERTARSSGCPVPRSVAIDSAATNSAARIGRSTRSLRTAPATEPRAWVNPRPPPARS
jgi:hypothetical protein